MQQHKSYHNSEKMKLFAQNFRHTNLLTPEEVGHTHMYAAYFNNFTSAHRLQYTIISTDGVEWGR